MSCQRENCQSVGLVPIILINSHLSARKESFCIIKGNFHRHFLLERIVVTGRGMESGDMFSDTAEISRDA